VLRMEVVLKKAHQVALALIDQPWQMLLDL
jgi:hypothetical protein